MVAAGLLGSIETVALARVAVTLAFIPGLLLAITRVLPVSPADLLALHPLLPDVPWLRLLAEAAAGAAIYPASLMLLWQLAGAPAGVRRRCSGGCGVPARSSPGCPRRSWRRRGCRRTCPLP